MSVRYGSQTIVSRAALDDSGMDVEGFLALSCRERASDEGYQPIEGTEVVRIMDPLDPEQVWVVDRDSVPSDVLVAYTTVECADLAEPYRADTAEPT